MSQERSYQYACGCMWRGHNLWRQTGCALKHDNCEDFEVNVLMPAPAPIHDPVTSPAHYTRGKIQVWDFIVDQGLCFLAGNVLKYVCRYRHKGHAVEDLRKARAYLDRLIQQVEAAR